MADRALVLPMTARGELVLVRLERPFGASLELPGRDVDPGASAEDAARSALTSIGYVEGTWAALGSVRVDPARGEARVHLFLASGVRRSGPGGAVVVRPLSDAIAMLDGGEVEDAASVVAIQRVVIGALSE